VTLIGDHTDYNEGVSLPMAVDLGTEVCFAPDDGLRVVLRAAGEPDLADVDIHVPLDPAALAEVQPRWARYVAGVVAAVRPTAGGRGTVEGTVPVGSGLASSASLQVALALALGFRAEPPVMAEVLQRAEQAATGVPAGLLDQLTITGGRAGHALLVDLHDRSLQPVPVPDGAEIIAVDSGERRTLARTGYAARRAECDAAAARLGPLGRIGPADFMGIPDAVLRRRVRHVVTECDRVRWCADALASGDLAEAGRLMLASHRSLAEDFEVSTPALDQLVALLASLPGVHGARLTGAGFGGCVVALAEPGAVDLTALATPAWRLRPAGAARVTRDP
jgi:galactokinase